MATSGTADAGEYKTHNLRLQWPFRMLLAGCSGNGKSTLTTRLVVLSSRVLTRTPARVLVLYSHMQPAYRELARQAPCPVKLLDGDLSTSPSNWPRSPGLWSSLMTCKRPTPAWWVLGSRSRPIIMTHPSFIWYRMFLTKTPATRPLAWMLLISSCSRTSGTCPRSPTWTSKYTGAVMTCWQPPIATPHPPGPTATWWLTSTSQPPRNFACLTSCFLMRTSRRHSPMDPPVRPEKRGVIAGEGPPISPAMGPHSGWPGTSAAWLLRLRPPGKCRQRAEDGFYRTFVATSTRSSAWAAAGGLLPRAPRHPRWTARRRHSKGPPRVGTVHGPLPMVSAASHGPDQGGGPRPAVAKSHEVHEATAGRRTDIGCGGKRLWGRWRGQKCGSPVQHQTTLDLHHSAGRAPAGTGLAGLGKQGCGHTAQDCASQGLGIAGAADGWWLYQLEAWYPGVDCRWHRTQGHQPSGPGRTCHATAPARESPVLGWVKILQGALLVISVFADDLMLTDGSRALTVSQSETSHC